MSSLFNQTNLAPGTAFATGGGGGSNFPNGISIGTASPQYLVNAQIWNQASRATFYNGDPSLNNLAYIQGAGLQVYNTFVENQSGIFNDQGITYLSSGTGGGLIQNLAIFNAAGMSNLNQNLAFALRGVSSIQTATRVINADRLLSTVQGYGWA